MVYILIDTDKIRNRILPGLFCLCVLSFSGNFTGVIGNCDVSENLH